MTNYVAFWIMAVIIAVFVADHYYFDWGLPLIMGHTAVAVIQYVAFWR